MTDQTATEEAEQLVDGVVEDERTQIVEDKEQTIQNLVNNVDNFREFNVVMSETRRRLDQ